MRRPPALAVSWHRNVGPETASAVARGPAPCEFSRKEVTGRRIAPPSGESQLITLGDTYISADHPVEVYRFLRDECGARFMQFIPIIEHMHHPGEEWSSWHDRPLYKQEGIYVTERSVTAEQFGRFHIGVFDEWVKGA